jgi:hypothetical protein
MTSLFPFKKYDWKEGRRNSRVNFAVPEKRKLWGHKSPEGL